MTGPGRARGTRRSGGRRGFRRRRRAARGRPGRRGRDGACRARTTPAPGRARRRVRAGPNSCEARAAARPSRRAARRRPLPSARDAPSPRLRDLHPGPTAPAPMSRGRPRAAARARTATSCSRSRARAGGVDPSCRPVGGARRWRRTPSAPPSSQRHPRARWRTPWWRPQHSAATNARSALVATATSSSSTCLRPERVRARP